MKLKTMGQIRKRVSTLKRVLREKEIYENFGDNEIRKLENFIGDIYSYSYDDRMEIISITEHFSSWCANYTGN